MPFSFIAKMNLQIVYDGQFSCEAPKSKITFFISLLYSYNASAEQTFKTLQDKNWFMI